MKLCTLPLQIFPFPHVIQEEINFSDARYIFEECILPLCFVTVQHCVFFCFQKSENWLLVPLFDFEQHWGCYSAFNKLYLSTQPRDVNKKHTGRKCQEKRENERGRNWGLWLVSSVFFPACSFFQSLWLHSTVGNFQM